MALLGPCIKRLRDLLLVLDSFLEVWPRMPLICCLCAREYEWVQSLEGTGEGGRMGILNSSLGEEGGRSDLP